MICVVTLNLGSQLILKHENKNGLEKCFGIQFTFSQVWENTNNES